MLLPKSLGLGFKEIRQVVIEAVACLAHDRGNAEWTKHENRGLLRNEFMSCRVQKIILPPTIRLVLIGSLFSQRFSLRFNSFFRDLHALKEDVRALGGALHVGMSRVHGQVVVLFHGIPVDEPRQKWGMPGHGWKNQK